MQRLSMTLGALAVVVACGAETISAQEDFVAARYVSGELPATPVLGIAGGQVFLEVLVGVDGSVSSIRTLRTAPPFTEAVLEAVRGWQFTPATHAVPTTPELALGTEPVVAPVFVAAMFAAPTLNAPTLGEPAQDVQSASMGAPMPTAARPAAYPPLALGYGTVLVEVTIDDAGVVTDARIVMSSPGFDGAALEAARSWSFRPGHENGRAVTAQAYLVFAFQQPVVGR